MISGPGSILSFLKPTGALDPLRPVLVLPEVVDEKLWYGGKFEWADTEERYLLLFASFPSHMVVVNANMVKPEEIRSYYDLLNPKWKGKIIMNDPTIGGGGSAAFNALVYNKVVDLDYFRQLIANNPIMLRDQDLQLTWVAQGKYSIAFWVSTSRLSYFIEAGAPLKNLDDIKEGTYLGSGGSSLTIINKAPHPNAAKAFINWFLSKEGQVQFQKQVMKQSARNDIPPEGIPLSLQRKPGAKYFPKPDEKEAWNLKHQDEYIKIAEQLFAPLLK